MNGTESEIEPISPEAAAAILQPLLCQSEAEGWRVLVYNDYNAMLHRADKNLHIRIDLLGQVETLEKPLTPGQENARLVGYLLLVVMIALIITVASVLGVID